MSKTTLIEKGSFKELWQLSFPLMISFLSLFVMIFVDRIFLSYYSTATLNAAASAGTFCWSFCLFWTTLASLAEVFVAQYNGAKQYKKLSRPVWQMIWLGLLSFLFFVPMAFFGSNFFYGSPGPTNFEYDYFYVTMLFGPANVCLAALTAFFVGQGKTSIIKWLALFGNLINIALDPILIFGIPGIVPSYGISGACIATGIGVISQVVIMFAVFMRKSNRLNFNSFDYRFYWKSFLQCLRIGLPPAFFVFFELLGWSMFYWMMSLIGPTHIFVSSVCQSILILFLFFGLGLEKGSAAVAGNLIGSNKIEKLNNLIKSGFKMILVFSAFILLFFIIYPDILINFFFKNPEAFDAKTNGINLLSGASLTHLKSLVRFGLIFTGIHLILENARWLISGILTAAGDTMFLMISGALSVWFFMIVPSYFFILKKSAPIEHAFYIWIAYSTGALLIFLVRFIFGGWRKKALVIDDEGSSPEIEAVKEDV